MTTAAPPHVSSFDHLAQEQRMQRALRAIDGHGWRQRLAPLAEHMGNRRLVRARSDRGAALDLLDLDRLREALMRVQRHDPVQAYLAVRGHVVSADLGCRTFVLLTRLLRKARLQVFDDCTNRRLDPAIW